MGYLGAAIYKMFGLRHFQALKNDRSVSQHNFSYFFYIFNFFIPGRHGRYNKRMLTRAIQFYGTFHGLQIAK